MQLRPAEVLVMQQVLQRHHWLAACAQLRLCRMRTSMSAGDAHGQPSC